MEQTMIATLCVAVIFLLFEYLSILKKMKAFTELVTLLVGYLAKKDKITLEDMQDISIEGIEKITKELEDK